MCEADGERVGVCGLEHHGDAGLVRSVAIEEEARGNGYGKEACDALLDRARSADLSAVYLLTTTADGFFGRLGFDEVARESVPSAIRNTDEFADLRPSTAVAMRRELDGSVGAGHE